MKTETPGKRGGVRRGTAPSTIVNAEPTKELFIEMLTKDIGLEWAILDLVDNSIDAARHHSPRDELDGFRIGITMSGTEFSILDNCGGIPLEDARQYAFRFGRPTEIAAVKNAIGLFGVGMKRALFKLGNRFEVRSRTAESAFSLVVDVPRWKEEPEWRFTLSPEDDTAADAHTHGTSISVTDLHPAVADELSDDGFASRLRDRLSSAHTLAISDGIHLDLNGDVIVAVAPSLLLHGDFRPANATYGWPEGDPQPKVRIRLIVGVGDSDPHQAGWHVYCNGRLVIEADQSELTAWGARTGTRARKAPPKFHNQFARFRGYALLDAADGSELPWNTTKTGVDASTCVYQYLRLRMGEAMRPVIDFLNVLDRENELPAPKRGPLNRAVAAARSSYLGDLQPLAKFTWTKPPEGAKTVSIQYRRPADAVRAVQERLGVPSAAKAGEETFDRYYRMICDEDD